MKLVIAEKPIAANRIAAILGHQPKLVKRSSVDCFELPDMVIVPLKGHVVDVDFPKALNNWARTPLHDLVHSEIEYTPSNEGVKKAVSFYAPQADELIIACDYDREGESIGKEAISIAQRANPKLKKVKRAKFSSLTEKEVKDAFSKLSDFNYNLADSADTRREIDLVWGAVLTRYVSLTSQRLGKDFLSVGRVQSPTLALCVDREKEIRSFKPETFWAISILCDKKGETFTASYEEEKIFDKAKADRVAALKSDIAKVVEVEKKELMVKPPAPFNTNEFLRSASNLGFQPERALSLAESLYMSGYISYPRTDNTEYPKTLDLREILQNLSKVKEFEAHTKKLLAQKTLTPTKGDKTATDHPPVHPVEAAPKAKLGAQEWKIYELVCRRFFATLAPPSKVETVKADLDYVNERFIARGKTILEKGWREYYPYSKAEDVILPELVSGESVAVKSLDCKEDKTKPRARYTPSALLKLMDELNLGTKATRAGILQKLIDRGYLVGKKNFTPSEIAFGVISALEEYAGDVTKATMTAELEEEMDGVEKGAKAKTDVVEDSRAMLHRIVDELEANKLKVAHTLQNAVKATDVVGKCPQCGEDLKIIRTQRGTRFIGCAGYRNGCRTSFPLPAKGMIKPMHTLCKDCSLPMIEVRYSGKRPFQMCINHKCVSKANWGKKEEKKEEKK